MADYVLFLPAFPRRRAFGATVESERKREAVGSGWVGGGKVSSQISVIR